MRATFVAVRFCLATPLTARVADPSLTEKTWKIRGRALVRYHSRDLGSGDIAARRAARWELLEIGRPAIDGLLPRIVADEVTDRIDRPFPWQAETLVFVGRRIPGERQPSSLASGFALERYGIDAVLFGETRGKELPVLRRVDGKDADGRPDPIQQAFDRRSTGRVLVCVAEPGEYSGPSDYELVATLVLPLDDDLEPAILEALGRQRIGRGSKSDGHP